MTDDVVTAREVAAPSTDALPLQDAQLICEKLNDALAAESFDRATYSRSVRSLFQQAWAVAAHKNSVQVTIYHLAYALVFHNPETGKKLAEVLGSDVDSFAVGCILCILPLGVSTGDAEIVPPAVGTVRWLGQAVVLALERGRRSELLPDDLVRAVLDGAVPAAERVALRRAARVGNARHDTVLGSRPVPSIAAAPPSSRDIIKHMEEVEKGYSPDPESDVTDLRTVLEEFEERYSADVKDHKHALARIEMLLDRRLTRAPSAATLAAWIVAVLTLGVAAGLALRFSQAVGSLLAQFFLASVK
jgi:hypothetical protein